MQNRRTLPFLRYRCLFQLFIIAWFIVCELIFLPNFVIAETKIDKATWTTNKQFENNGVLNFDGPSLRNNISFSASEGILLGPKSFFTLPHTNRIIGSIIVTSDNTDDKYLYVTGTERNRWILEKREPSTGDLVWQTETNGGVSVIEADSNGLYIGGSNGDKWHVEKRSLDNGNLIWEQTSKNGGVSDIVIASDNAHNYLYLVGSSEQKWHIEKRNIENGVLVEEFGEEGSISLDKFSSWPWGYDTATSITADYTGIYIAGVGIGAVTYLSGIDNVWRIEKRSLDSGELIWQQHYPGVSPWIPWYEPFPWTAGAAHDIAWDPTGIYIAGFQGSAWTYSQFYRSSHIEKRDFDGNLIWLASKPAGQANSIAIDGDHLYVAGWRGESVWHPQWTIEKRVADTGELIWLYFSGEPGGVSDIYIDDTGFYAITPSGMEKYSKVHYSNKGTISGLKIHPKETKSQWNTISWNATIPDNTIVKFRTRGADNEEDLANAAWSDYYTISGSSITASPSEWLEIELTLESADDTNTPVLHDVSVDYEPYDTIPPEISVFSPEQRDYQISEDLTINYSATDDLSGVASVNATLDGQPVENNQLIDLFNLPLGQHIFKVTATDNVGNSTAKEGIFNTVATPESAILVIEELLSNGQITSPGVANSLIFKLSAALSSIESGNENAAIGQLNSFVNSVEAQLGKKIDAEMAQLLIKVANSIIDDLL